MDFIGRDELIAAMNAWVLEKGKPLGRMLVERGAIDQDEFALMEPLVAKPRRAARWRPGAEPGRPDARSSWIRRDLQAIADPALHASLTRLGAAADRQADSAGTVTSAVGDSSIRPASGSASSAPTPAAAWARSPSPATRS